LQKENLVSWRHIHPQRARSNNSVLLLRNEVTKEEFVKIIERTKQFGEPGFVWGNHKWQLFNPCFEIGFIPVTEDGVCGVQFCNLTSKNGRKADTKEKFKECVEAEVIIGTLQAGYTDFPYLSKAAKILTEEEALLGCSMTGIMDNPSILLDAENQKELAKFAITINEEWAKKIGIRQAARITCVKPEGTSSLVLGTGSGIHPHHARKYFRRVMANKQENVYKHFKKSNKDLCELSVWSATKTDDVVSFPIQVSEKAIIKSDLNALKHLKYIKSTQQNWVLNGVTPVNKKPIEHNVSCTVIVKDNEWNDVIDYIFDNRKFFAAISLLPDGSDKSYPQAPMEAISTPEDEERWKKITENFNHVDFKSLKEDDDFTKLNQEISCAGGSCQIVNV
jgi:ribonucleoside-diphosphate reductase alpha chain